MGGLLREWGASAEVQLAGFCHACYGTAGFDVPLLDLAERPWLAEVIGAGGPLSTLYGSCDRASVYPQLGTPGLISGTGLPVSRPSRTLEIFSTVTRHQLHHDGVLVKTFHPELTAQHVQVLDLMELTPSVYTQLT